MRISHRAQDILRRLALCAAALLCALPGVSRAEHKAYVIALDSSTVANEATPKYQAFDGTTWGAQAAAASLGTGGGWFALKPAPIRNEMLLGYHDANSAIPSLYLQVWGGASWANTRTITQDAVAANSAQRTWDLAYEQTSGKAWVAYRSAATGGPSADTWDGTAWVAQGAIGSGWPATAINWIRMESRPGSNEITMIVQFPSTLWASVYNGTSWSAATQLEGTGPPIAGPAYQPFDLAYEKSNGRCVALWVRDGSGSSDTFVSIKQLGGVWDSTSTIVSTGTNLPTQEDPVRFIRLAANPVSTSNEILAVWLDGIATTGNTTDANAMIWNGTSWGSAVELAANSNAIAGGSINSRPFDAVYDSTGTGFAIWNSATAGVPSFKPWTGSWGTTQSGGSIGASAADFWIADANPTNSQIVLTGKDNSATNTVLAQLLGGATAQIVSASAGATATLPCTVVAWRDGTAPAAPTGLTKTDPGTTVLNLNWTANTETDLKDYRIHRSTNAGVVVGGTQTVVLATVAKPGTTHQDPGGLTAGLWYYYKLTARDGSLNESAASAEVSGAPGTPATPTGLGLADPGTTVLNLSWTANTEVDREDYRIHRSTNAGVVVGGTQTVVLAVIASPGTTHQDAAGLTAGRWYYYKITARDTSLNESAASSEVSGAPGAPGTPAGLGTADAGTGGALNVSWTANTENDLKDYRIYRSTNGNVTAGSSWTVTLATVLTPGTTHRDANLTGGTTYYFKLDARDTSLNASALSAQASAVVVVSADTTPPAAPTGLTMTDPGTTVLNLSWTANTETDRKDYRIHRSTNAGVVVGGTQTVVLATNPGTTHQDSGGLTAGRWYYYKITARDTSLNESGGSSEVSGAPGTPGTPTGFALTDPNSGTTLNLSWTANTEDDRKDYRVYRSTNSGVTIVSSHVVTAILSPGTTHQDAGLTSGTRYNYRLTARDTSLNESGGATEILGVPGAPAAPAGLTVGDPGTTALNLNWTTSGEADLKDYRIHRSTNAGVVIGGTQTVVLAVITAGGTTHQDAGGLTAGKWYYYKITARDTFSNESGGSSEVSAAPGTPATPTGLALSDPNSGTTLTLSWTANTEDDRKDYRVYRSTNSGVTIVSSHVVTAILSPGTTHQDGGLTSGTRYNYRLTARDTSLNESGGATEILGVPGAPAAPAGLTLTDPGTTVLNLNWTTSGEADLKDYRIHRSTNAGVVIGGTQTVVLAVITAGGTTHQDAGGLTAGRWYYYKLTARDSSSNESGGSSEVSGAPGTPATPTGLALSDPNSGTTLTLSWTANTEDDRKDYRVYRSTNAGVTMVSSHVVTAILSPGTTHQDGGLTSGTRYNYRLTARDTSLNESGGATEILGVPGAPAAPTGLALSDPGSGTALNLSWTANTEADRKDYRVYRSTNAGVTIVSSHVVTAILSPGTTHQDAGLTAGTRYNYKLTVRDTSLNESGGSSEALGIPGAPAAPSGLTLGDPGTTVLNLNWTANTEGDLKDYRIHRSTNAGVVIGGTQTVVLAVIASPGTTHQDAAGLTAGRWYYYKLAARDTSSNESGGSSEVSGAPGTPATPTGLALTDPNSGTTLTLSWTANTEDDRKDYRVYRSTNAGVTMVSSHVVTAILSPGTTHQDAGLTSGTRYNYRLTARDTSLNESGGATEILGVPGAPATPTGFALADPGSGTVLNLSWTANAEGDLKDYRVYRSTNSGVTIVSSHVVTAILSPGTTHQDAGLTSGTRYNYRLTARDTNLNESGGATEILGVPGAPAAPAGPTVGDPGTTVLNLNWTTSGEADLKDYRIHRSTNAGVVIGGTQTVVLAVIAAGGTTHQDAGGLTAGRWYYYKLTARDSSSNESGGSAEVSGAPGTPAAPTGLGLSDPGTTALNLSWTANTEADRKDYRVYRSTNAGVTIVSSHVVTAILSPGTTHQDAGLTSGTQYNYTLTARDTSLNESGGASEVSGVPGVPATPTGFALADPGSGTALNLSWTANTEADRKDYRVYRSTNAGVTIVSSHVVTAILSPGTTHQDAGLTSGTRYNYRLTARDTALNESGGATEILGVPGAPATPAGLTVGDPGTTVLNLNWTANAESDLKDYRVHRSTNAGVVIGGTQTVVLAVIAAGGTTHQDAGLTSGMRYNYKVTVRDTSLNESGGSSEVSGVAGAPAAPGGVGVADVAGDEGVALRLSWTANTEADLKDYRVYRSTNGNVTAGSSWTVTLATLVQPGTTHQDAGLTPVTTYYYKVTARDNSLNEGTASSEVNLRPVDNTAPSAPGSAPTVADVPSDQGFSARLNWSLNTETDVREYRLYRSTNGNVTAGSSWTVISATVLSPGTTRQDDGLVNGTTYYYKFAARDTSANESGLSPEGSGIPYDNIAPSAPTGPGVTDPGSGTVLNLSWTGSGEPDVKDYRIYRSTNVGVTLVSSHVVVTILDPGSTHQDAGLTSGRRYNYKITARDVSQNQSAGTAEVWSVPGAPGAPTGFGVADVAGDQGVALNLSWGANGEADLQDYKVYRSTNGNVTVGSTWTITLATLVQPGTTHQDAGLTPVTTYYFKVTARDLDLNESSASGEVNLRPADNTAPAAPGSAPTVADVPGDTGGAIRLNWSLNTETDVREYGIYRSTTGNVTVGSSWTALVTLVLSPGTTRQDAGLTDGTTYYYKFTARDTSGNESGLSPQGSAYPAYDQAPAAPTGLALSDPGTTVLNLSWTANTEGDLKDYRLYRSTNTGVTRVSSHVVTAIAKPGTTHQDAGLTSGTQYNYALTARNSVSNESSLSSEISGVAGAPAAPTGLGIGDPGTTVLNLSWTASTEADRKDYRIYRSTNAGVTLVSTHVVTAIASPGTTHQDAGLTSGTRYNYVLTARDTSLNEGGGSGEASGVAGTPSAPTGLGAAAPAAGNLANLSWAANAEGDLKDYGLYRATWSSTLAGKSLITRVAQPGTTCQDAGLANGTTYYWQITARDTGLNASGGSGEVSATPQDTIAPAAITNLSAVSGGDLGEIILSWTASGDDGASGSATSYLLRYSTLSSITTNGGFDAGSTYSQSWTPLSPATTETRVASLLTAGATYYFSVKAVDDAGNRGALSNAASAVAQTVAGRTIDGNAAEWKLLPGGVSTNAAQMNGGEWIWKDKTGEERTVSANPSSNFDLTEFHVYANSDSLYFLAKLRDITNADYPLLAVSIDKDQSAGDTQIGPEVISSTASLQHGGGYQAPAASHYGEYAMIVHSTSTGSAAIEIRADSGATWSAPATYGAGAAAISAANDVVEWRVARADLGLAGAQTIRLAVAVFENNVGLANTVDVTKNYNLYASSGSCDALDVMNIVRVSTGNAAGQYTNDPRLTLGTTVEGLDQGGNATTGTLDYVAEIALPASSTLADIQPGVVTQLTPAGLINTLTPALTWSAASDPDSGDLVVGYMVEVTTTINFDTTAAYRINVPSTTTSWTIPSNLTEGTNYFWRARARDRSGLLSAAAQVKNFRADVTAPNAITAITAVAGSGAGEVTLTWAAPGSDYTSGQAVSYVVKYGTLNLTSQSLFNQATTYSQSWSPLAPYTTETHTLINLTTTYNNYFAIEAVDKAGNQGTLSNIGVGYATPKSAPTLTASTTDHVVIGEVWAWELTTKEWVSLYNPTPNAVNIGGWMVGTNASATDIIFPGTATIAAFGFYKCGDPGAGTPRNDLDSTITITNTNSYVQLRNATSSVIDVVAWGTGTNMPAGTTAYTGAMPSGSQGLVRNPGSPDGNGTDTDNCNSDFVKETSSSSGSSISTTQGSVKQYTVGVYNHATPYANNARLIPLLRIKVANEKAPGDVSVEVATITVRLKSGGTNLTVTTAQALFDNAYLFLDSPTTGEVDRYQPDRDTAQVGAIATGDFSNTGIFTSTGGITFNQVNGKLHNPDTDANLTVAAGPDNYKNYFFVVRLSTWAASVNMPFTADCDGDADVGLRNASDNAPQGSSVLSTTGPVTSLAVTTLAPQATTWAYFTGSGLYSLPRLNVAGASSLSEFDTIYVGGEDGRLYAIWATGASQGTLKWAYTTAGSDKIRVQPIARKESGSRYIYFSDDGGYLYKLLDNGASSVSDQPADGGWRLNLGGRVRSTPQIVAPLGDTQSYLYIGSGDSRVFKIELASGGIVATSPILPGTFSGSPSFTPDGDFLFMGASNMRMYRLNASDLTLANQTGDLAGAITSSVFTRFDGSTSFFGAPDANGTIYMRDASNLASSWTVTLGAAVESDVFVTSRGATSSNYKVYVPTTGGKLYRLWGDTGSTSWSFPPTGTVGPIRCLPVPDSGIAPTYVYFGSDDGGIYQVKADGTGAGDRDSANKWPVYVGGEVRAILLTTWDNRLYAASTDGRIYCFSTP